MGSPKELTAAQIVHLNELTRDLPETDKVMRSGADGTVELTVPMNSNDIVLVKLERSAGKQMKEKVFCLSLRNFALPLLLMGLLSAASAAQNVAAHPHWPGLGQLFVGACYQPIDRTPEQIDDCPSPKYRSAVKSDRCARIYCLSCLGVKPDHFSRL